MRQCWNWFRPEDQRRGGGEPSLIAGITEEVIRQHGVDPKRVYIAGLSAGGAAAAIMGDVYPDLYAGVCVHSGLPSAAAQDMASAFDAMRLGAKVQEPSARLVPTIIFHGEKDMIVNPSNGEAVAAKVVGSASGLRREAEQGRTAGGRNYVRTSYADEKGRTCANTGASARAATHGQVAVGQALTPILSVLMRQGKWFASSSSIRRAEPPH